MQRTRRRVVPLLAACLTAVAACQPNGAASMPPAGDDEVASAPAEDERRTPVTLAGDRENVPFDRTTPQEGLAEKEFIEKAADVNLAEIELSRLVLERTQKRGVREFAQKMIRDHGRAHEELNGIARGLDVQLPTALSEEARSKKQTLAALDGTALDEKYVEIMVLDHREAVSMFREASAGLGPELQPWATKTLRMLEEHLAHALALESGRPYMGPQAVAPPPKQLGTPAHSVSATRH
jgi:putative membrane protein